MDTFDSDVYPEEWSQKKIEEHEGLQKYGIAMANLTEYGRKVAGILEYYGWEMAGVWNQQQVYNDMENVIPEEHRKIYHQDLFDIRYKHRIILEIKAATKKARKQYKKKKIRIDKHITFKSVDAQLKRHISKVYIEHVRDWFYRLHPRYSFEQVKKRHDAVQFSVMKQDLSDLSYLVLDYYKFTNANAASFDMAKCQRKMMEVTEFQYLQMKHCYRITDSNCSIILDETTRFRLTYIFDDYRVQIMKDTPKPAVKPGDLDRIYERVKRKNSPFDWRKKFVKRLFFKYGRKATWEQVEQLANNFLTGNKDAKFDNEIESKEPPYVHPLLDNESESDDSDMAWVEISETESSSSDSDSEISETESSSSDSDSDFDLHILISMFHE